MTDVAIAMEVGSFKIRPCPPVGVRVWFEPINLPHHRRPRRNGYGRYLGEVFISDVSASGGNPHLARAKTPKIKLDTGQIVYGFECWWTTELIPRLH